MRGARPASFADGPGESERARGAVRRAHDAGTARRRRTLRGAERRRGHARAPTLDSKTPFDTEARDRHGSDRRLLAIGGRDHRIERAEAAIDADRLFREG